MSDDQIKLLTDSDEEAPATPAVSPTQPTLDTVLERINELGQRLSREIQTLRTEMNDELLNLKAEQEKQGRRIDELERKAS